MYHDGGPVYTDICGPASRINGTTHTHTQCPRLSRHSLSQALHLKGLSTPTRPPHAPHTLSYAEGKAATFTPSVPSNISHTHCSRLLFITTYLGKHFWGSMLRIQVNHVCRKTHASQNRPCLHPPRSLRILRLNRGPTQLPRGQTTRDQKKKKHETFKGDWKEVGGYPPASVDTHTA